MMPFRHLLESFLLGLSFLLGVCSIQLFLDFDHIYVYFRHGSFFAGTYEECFFHAHPLLTIMFFFGVLIGVFIHLRADGRL